MSDTHWPLNNLRLTTDRLVLRPVRDEDLGRMIDILEDVRTIPNMEWWWEFVQEGIGDFRVQAARQFWRWRADWSHDNWNIVFSVFHNDELIGAQQLFARKFHVVRSLESGSWLDTKCHGRGFGKEMRAAVLHLAFEHLGALEANTCAAIFNGRSQGVSRSLGYEENGVKRSPMGDKSVEEQYFRMTRERWFDAQRPTVKVEGFEPCRFYFFKDADGVNS